MMRPAETISLKHAAYGLWQPFRRSRKGQTTVEYLLVTLALTIAFSLIYGVLQAYLTREFTAGGKIILKMYKVDW